MFLRATDERGRDVIRALSPAPRTRPATRGHQVAQRLANGRRIAGRWRRPGKPVGTVTAQRHKYQPRAQLRHTVVAGIEKPPACLIIHFAELDLNPQPVVGKSGGQQTPHIFNHHGSGLNFVNQTNRGREEIALVLNAELLAGYGKGWTGQSAGQQIDLAAELAAIVGGKITFLDQPAAVEPQGLAAIPVYFDAGGMVETCLFEPESLTTRPGAYLQ